MNKAELKQLLITLRDNEDRASKELYEFTKGKTIEMGLLNPEVKKSEEYKRLSSAHNNAQAKINYISKLLPQDFKVVTREIALEKRAIRFGLVK